MLKRMLASALFAGLAAGVVASVLHFTLLVPVIIEAEEYESGALVHFSSAPDATTAITDKQGAQERPDTSLWHRDTNQLHRGIMTFGMELVAYTGFALVLVALYALAGRFGHRITIREGILWGFAGFLAYNVAPAAGLPAETPGIPAADLAARQMWWLGTVLATGIGLALLAFGRNLILPAIGIVLIAIPHLIGAPHPQEYAGVAPPTLEGLFAGRSIAVAAVTWTLLGLLTAYFWVRAQRA